MKKIVKLFSLLLVVLAVVATPLLGFVIAEINQIDVYQKTYSAALVDKVNLLKENKDKKKMILIGGSNVAFGFNSELLKKEYPDYEIINFGLYAALGTKLMLEVSKPYINKGDIVFIAPEISSETMSMYFNGLNTLQAIETDMSIYSSLSRDSQKYVNSAYFQFVIEKGQYSEPINATGVYQRQNFNSFMDVEYLKRDEENKPILDENGNTISLKKENKMAVHYLPGHPVDYTKVLDDQKFFDYVNEYNKYLISHNAKSYYAFCPVNKLSTFNSESEILDFYWTLRSKLSFPVIGNPIDYIMDAKYFYDTNFHLNDAGAIARTYNFVLDVNREVFNNNHEPHFDKPEAPEFPVLDPEDQPDSDTSKYFNYEKQYSGDNFLGYTIKSIKPDFVNLKEIELPSVYDHKFVLGIEKYAFKDSLALEKIIIPETYTFLINGAFDECATLQSVYLRHLKPETLLVDYTGGLIRNKAITIYVPNKSYGAYVSDYNWSAYKDFLKGYENEI